MSQELRQPNILFILTDHQAHYGHHRPGEYEYRWPHFDTFCAQGTRFDRTYCVAPVCTPARSSMMSGLYPSRHGLRWNTDAGAQWPTQRLEFAPGTQLYSHHLSRAGYRNAYIGKWHCGYERLPVDYGIEGWSLPAYGRVFTSDAYKAYAEERGYGPARARIELNEDHPEWAGQTLTLHHESPWHFMNGCGVLQGPPEANEMNFVAHLAVEKLRELARGSRPWSLVASFWGPHQPYYPSEPYASMVDPAKIPEYPSFRDDLRGRPMRYIHHRDFNHRSAHLWKDWAPWQTMCARAYAQGLQTDAAIAGILEALDETGQAEDTLVIWTADHGDALASHGGLFDKASHYIEEVARVPMAVRWPNGLPAGQSTDKLVSNLDVTATMLDAAGAGVPEEMDSRSLLPLARDSGARWPEQMLCEHHGHGDFLPMRILFHGNWKYVAALFDGDELYDLAADPFERHNLIDSPAHAAPRAAMRKRLIEALAGRTLGWDRKIRRALEIALEQETAAAV